MGSKNSKLVDFPKIMKIFYSPEMVESHLYCNITWVKKVLHTAINTKFKKYWQYGGNTQKSIANSIAVLLVLQY